MSWMEPNALPHLFSLPQLILLPSFYLPPKYWFDYYDGFFPYNTRRFLFWELVHCWKYPSDCLEWVLVSRPVKYFSIDFDLSLWYFFRNNCHEIEQIGQDHSMLTPYIPYDLFKSDVYPLGNVIFGTIAEWFMLSAPQWILNDEGLELFQEIGMTMTKAELDERPLAYEATQQLEAFIFSLSTSALKHRVWQIGDIWMGTINCLLVKYFRATCFF